MGARSYTARANSPLDFIAAILAIMGMVGACAVVLLVIVAQVSLSTFQRTSGDRP